MKRFFCICLLLLTLVPCAPAIAASAAGKEASDTSEINVSDVIFSHIGDSYEWHMWTWKGHPVAIYLPVILYSKTSGWHVFSSKHIAEGETYEGFRIQSDELKYSNKLVEVAPDGSVTRPLDLSITKNVLSLMISSLLILVIVLLTARWYRTHDSEKKAPEGLAAFMEPVIMMIHEMARENIGEEDYKKYSPYLITVFLFIITNNFLGIIPIFPGGANLTGNIACTLVLALFTFFIVNLFGNKEYYREIFLPDVPGFLKPIMPVIEVFSALMKPVSLTVRLFANMLAGHIQILSVMCLIFIMAKYGGLLLGGMTIVSVAFGLFLDVLELLISFIQAFVFTMLSSIYIGLAHQKE